MNGVGNAPARLDLPVTGTTTYPTSKGKIKMTDISPGNTGMSDTPSVGVWPQWLTRRRVMFAAAATVVGSGMALNWGWLTAIGLAPILVSLAPCAAMCGLGLCMKGGSGKGCSKSTGNPSPD
jgi:hypothetical protein